MCLLAYVKCVRCQGYVSSKHEDFGHKYFVTYRLVNSSVKKSKL